MPAETLQYETPDQALMVRQATAVLDDVKAIVIDSPEMLEYGTGELTAIVTRKKQLTEQRMSVTRPMDEAKARIMDIFRGPIDYLEQAERTLKGSIQAYQRRLEVEARKQREDAERAARAERERLAAEARERAAAAETAAKEGREEEAAQMAAESQSLSMEAAVTVAPRVSVAAAPKGLSTRANWKAEVTSMAELVAYVAANPSFINLLTVDATALNALAKAQKEAFSIPGCRAFNDAVVAVRRAA